MSLACQWKAHRLPEPSVLLHEMIWSSFIKFHMQGSHHKLLQNASFTPHFSQRLISHTGSIGVSLSAILPRSLRLLLISLSSFLIQKDTLRHPVHVRKLPFPPWRMPERASHYSMKVSKQAGLEPATNDTNGTPGCSLPTQRSMPFIGPRPLNMFAFIVERAVLALAKGDSSTDLVQFRGGIRRGAKSAFVADGKKRSRSFSTPASRVFIKPPLNSLDLSCDGEVVAEYVDCSNLSVTV